MMCGTILFICGLRDTDMNSGYCYNREIFRIYSIYSSCVLNNFFFYDSYSSYSSVSYVRINFYDLFHTVNNRRKTDNNSLNCVLNSRIIIKKN